MGQKTRRRPGLGPRVEALEGRALLSSAGLRSPAALQAGGRNAGAQVYRVDLMTENNSGVTGQGTIVRRGNRLQVTLMISGLDPSGPHAIHVHGFAGQPQDKPSVNPPPSAADDDPTPNGLGTTIISETEATPFVGPIIKTLSRGVVVRSSGGTVTFRQNVTLTHDNYATTILPLEIRSLEVHGLTVGGTFQPTVGVAGGTPVPVTATALRARR